MPFGSRTFVPISWMCKKQTSVSHSSKESEIISLDAGLRLDGLPALDLWVPIVAVLHGNTYQSDQERADTCANLVRAKPHKLSTRKKSHGMIDDLDNVDFISSNVFFSRQEALLFVFQQTQPKSKTQSISTVRLVKSEQPSGSIAQEIDKGVLFGCESTNSRTERPVNALSFSQSCVPVCVEHVDKDEDADENVDAVETSAVRPVRVTAKSKPMMNLVSRCSERTPDVLPSTASESPGKTRQESQTPLSPQTEQHHRTGRPVRDAYSSSYSGRDVDKTWSSQEWKSDELMEVRTGRPVLFTQHTDRFIVENHDMDSDTEAESEMSLKSRSFLRRVNDHCEKCWTVLQKMQCKTSTNVL